MVSSCFEATFLTTLAKKFILLRENNYNKLKLIWKILSDIFSRTTLTFYLIKKQILINSILFKDFIKYKALIILILLITSASDSATKYQYPSYKNKECSKEAEAD